MDPIGEMLRSLNDLNDDCDEEIDEHGRWMTCKDYEVMIEALTAHEGACCCGVVCAAALVTVNNLPGCGMVEKMLRDEGPVSCEKVIEAAERAIGIVVCLGLPRRYAELKFCDTIRLLCPIPPPGFMEAV